MAKRLHFASGRTLKGCCNLEDRISLLPNEILVVILSSLELKDAATTSVLSRRWRSLWTHVTHLKFNAITKYMYSWFRGTREDETFKFIDQVNHVLQLHRGPSIEEFMVWFYLDDRFQTEIDKWLQFALARRVQRLELHLSYHPKFMQDEDKCSFPRNLFHKNEVPFLDKLHFNSSTMCQCTYVGFHSLKSLSLTCVNLSGKVVEYLLSICSVLENLCILGSGELVNLKVAGPSLALKFLKIDTCFNLKSLEICNAIKLVSFAYSGRKVHFLLKNVPSLVELSFDVSVFEFIEDYFSKFSCCFSYLETLMLSTTNFEGVWVLPQMVQPCVTEKIEVRKDVNCAHKYLEEVQLVGYYGRKNDLELVMYFLKNAVSLKKIVIDPCDASNHYMPKKSSRIEEEMAARNRAKQQLEGIVPENISLVIL